jgi:DNA repair exonuclease SbcCD nuclease subunit
MTIRCLHTADLHLDARFPAWGEKEALRRADLLKTFERIVNLAIKNDVQLLLISGDLFDSPHPEVATVARVQTELRRLQERGIIPVLLPGTHDPFAPKNSIYRRETFPGFILSEAQLSEPLHLLVKGVNCYLYGFAYQSGKAEELLPSMQRRNLPGFHIGLLHGSRRGSPEWDYRHKDLPFDLADLAALRLDYIALGHYHTFEILQDESGRNIAAYSGSPEGKRFGENGPRYCAMVTLSAGGAQIERVEVNGRTLAEQEIDLSGIVTLDGAIAEIRRFANPDLILRLRLTGTIEIPLALPSLLAACRDDFFWLELLDATRLYDSAYARRIEHEETVRGLFVRRMRRLIEESPPERRPIVEEAFREVLARFTAAGGEL